MTIFKRGVEALRQPDRNPRCYELTDAERVKRIQEWAAHNIQHSSDLAKQSHLDNEIYYGA